jgi:hypothetical protein
MSSFFIWSTASIRLVLELDDESGINLAPNSASEISPTC